MNTLKRGQILQDVLIEKIGPGGVGISTREDGKKIIAKGSILPHSKITGRITKNKRDYIELGHIETTRVDPDRSNEAPRCSHYHDPLVPVPEDQIHKFGVAGCQWQSVPYEKQLELKMEMIQDSFRGKDYLLEKTKLLPTIKAPLIDNYRNKIEFSFGKYISKASNDRKNSLSAALTEENTSSSSGEKEKIEEEIFSQYHTRQLGYHKKGHYDKIIDVDYCCLVSERVNKTFAYIKKKLLQSGLPVYDQKRHDGVLRNIFFREGFHTDELMINLVVSKDNILEEGHKDLRKDFLQSLHDDEYLQKEVKTFIVTDNSTLSDAMRRSRSTLETLWGPGTIKEELHIVSPQKATSQKQTVVTSDFQISPTSFFQTNTLGAEALFATAMSYARLEKGKSTILDLYCGTGSIGLTFLKAGLGEKLLGIEIVESAVEDAKINAGLNGLLEESYFVAGKAEELITSDEKIQESLDDIGLIIVDPPRSGLHPSVPEFLNKLKESSRFQLLYISCNPVTLARDLDLLVQAGRELTTLQAVDMFPHTHHVEMISVLQ